MELLKSLSRHLIVQKDLRLLNSGTLIRGRNLCVTVTIDHSTVDGFHDELQLSAKNTWGKALRRISWVKEFHLVRWNDYHSVSVFDLLKFHQFGSTVSPESLLEYVWYAGAEVWTGTLVVADLKQWTKIDASEFHNVKLNEMEMISPKLVTIPKTADGQMKFIGGDQVLRTPTLTRYHPSSRRSSRRPSWKIRRVSTNHQSRKSLHINTVYTEISDNFTKIASKIFGKACHEFGQQADSRRLLQVKPVAIVVPGLSMTSCSSSSSGTSPPTSLPQESTGSTRIPALIECESAEEQARRDQSRNPTKKLRVHDKYGETRYSSFDFFQKYRRHGMLIRTEQVFNVT